MAGDMNAHKVQKEVDAARLANLALANALALSEQDLAEAVEVRMKSYMNLIRVVLSSHSN
jgi:hypothetical protein